MVDYDAAVAAVQDPNADPILLAKIAYENPEFGANVAVNPRCYPGLKRWLAEFGDVRARETLAQIGFTADSIGGPVQDQPAEQQAPQESAAQPAQAQPEAQPAQAQPDASAYAGAYTDIAQGGTDSYAAQPASQPAAQSYAAAQPAQDQYAAAQPAEQLAAQPVQAQPEAQPQAEAQPQFENPTPTNPYGFTAEQALTTSDQMEIAQIAQYAPELRVCIARNPNTYQALLDWLRQLGDPAIDAALAARQ
ncbi:hypothetical protein JS530_03180 [Bifidobacterium sp. LC6]|uniref:Leucine rich repeat variant domain-containing protein n=1 Tax=Bifidobacterium colobi TaxID=2809026 RepID=A0ABS5UUW2_9BIFI|nr:hypothetical protein [Bifidobacterium colobi]MBT1174521.1 hypothetical protein [Bifidobacterium colobi]